MGRNIALFGIGVFAMIAVGLALFLPKLTQESTPETQGITTTQEYQDTTFGELKDPVRPTTIPMSTTPNPPQDQSGPPSMQIDQAKTYTAVLTTTAGVIEISLHADKTPVTVNNFVGLAKRNFYNNTIFHRVINGFMIQGGDPQGNGTGGPGYRFNDEPFDGQYLRGTVAMANAGPNTNGSQFFIMHADYPLPKNYVIFGNVTKGMEVVDAIASSPVKSGPSGENSSPVNPIALTTVQIREE